MFCIEKCTNTACCTYIKELGTFVKSNELEHTK